MGSNNTQTDEKIPVNTPSRVTFCQRKESGNGSFVSNLRNHFHKFIHASMDEHKTCLRNTIQKIFNASKSFGKSGDNTNERENSVPLQSSTRNLKAFLNLESSVDGYASNILCNVDPTVRSFLIIYCQCILKQFVLLSCPC